MEFKFEEHLSNMRSTTADRSMNSQVMTFSLTFCSVFGFMFVF